MEIRCEGHTDDLPLPKNAQFQSNWDLSTGRALNIVKLLSDFQKYQKANFLLWDMENTGQYYQLVR